LTHENSLDGTFNQQFFNFADCPGWIQIFRAGIGAIHDGMTTIQSERVFKFIQTFTGILVTTIRYPAIRL
jgi:hypothetical protein